MDYTLLFATIGSVMGMANSISYMVKTLQRKVKPHCFTWLIWGTLMMISGIAMYVAHAGFAAYAIGTCGLLCFMVGVLAIFYGHKHITAKDIVCLILAIIAVILWQLTDNPLTAILLTTSADLFGYVPTFRKVFHEPGHESAASFFTYAIADVFILLSIQSYSFASTLYPGAIFLANISLVIFILFRRKQKSMP